MPDSPEGGSTDAEETGTTDGGGPSSERSAGQEREQAPGQVFMMESRRVRGGGEEIIPANFLTRFVMKEVKKYVGGFASTPGHIALAPRKIGMVGRIPTRDLQIRERLSFQSLVPTQLSQEMERAQIHGGSIDIDLLLQWLDGRADHKRREVEGEDPNVKGGRARQRAWKEMRQLEIWGDVIHGLSTGEINEGEAKSLLRGLKKELILQGSAGKWSLRRGEIIPHSRADRVAEEQARARERATDEEEERPPEEKYRPTRRLPEVLRGGVRTEPATREPGPPPSAEPPSRPPAESEPSPPEEPPSPPEEPPEEGVPPKEFEEGMRVSWTDEDGVQHFGTVMSPEEPPSPATQAPNSPEPTQLPTIEETIDTDDPQEFINRLDNLYGRNVIIEVSSRALEAYIKSLEFSGAEIENLSIKFVDDEHCVVQGKVSAGWKGGADFTLNLANDPGGKLSVVSHKINARGFAKAGSGAIENGLTNIQNQVLGNINQKLKNNQITAISIGKANFLLNSQPV